MERVDIILIRGQCHWAPAMSTLSVLSLIMSWNAWVADGSTLLFSYSCFHYLPWYGSECTCQSRGGAVATHLQVHGLGQSWEDGEHALGLQQGRTCKILCAAWHKIHSLGQLEFFFSQQQRFHCMTMTCHGLPKVIRSACCLPYLRHRLRGYTSTCILWAPCSIYLFFVADLCYLFFSIYFCLFQFFFEPGK